MSEYYGEFREFPDSISIMYWVSGQTFLALWSKYHVWLCEFLDKSSNFGLLCGRVYGPLDQPWIQIDLVELVVRDVRNGVGPTTQSFWSFCALNAFFYFDATPRILGVKEACLQ